VVIPEETPLTNAGNILVPEGAEQGLFLWLVGYSWALHFGIYYLYGLSKPPNPIICKMD